MTKSDFCTLCTYIPRLLIILTILCPSSIIPEKLSTASNVELSNEIYSKFKQLNATKYLSNIEITSATRIIESTKTEGKKNVDADDEIFSDTLFKHRLKSSKENRHHYNRTSDTTNVFVNTNFQKRNDSSILYLKETVLKYPYLFENWTRVYLKLEKSNSTHNTNQTLYLNLAEANPLHVFCNLTNERNTSSSFDDIYFCANNKALSDGDVKLTNQDVHLEYTYPPWKNLTNAEKIKFLQLAQGASLRHGKGAAVGLTSYYGVLLLLGIPGNLLMCCIILSNSYMITAPNLFLFNIALADIFTLIFGKIIFNKYLSKIKFHI